MSEREFVMKVTAFVGSPHVEGNTFYAVREVCKELEKSGIETEIVNVGRNISGCLACGSCAGKGECVVADDRLNECLKKAYESDGLIFASPVYYAGIAGSMKSFMDRFFYAAGGRLRHKVGACISCARRSGEVAVCDQLMHYLSLAEMVLPTSTYWNVVHGKDTGESLLDAEGMDTMHTLGQNMAWVLNLIDYGRGHVQEPEGHKKIFTNFIRP